MTQPYQYPQPVAPKRHTARNVLLVIAGAFILITGGCLAVAANIGNDIAKDIEPGGKNAPQVVVVGQAFTIGKHETLAGWKVVNEIGMFTVTGKVKNISEDTSTAFIHIKFLSATGEVLGNVACNSGDLEPGQVQALSCLPDGKYGKYAKVTAEATF
jgi:hypothetical protein